MRRNSAFTVFALFLIAGLALPNAGQAGDHREVVVPPTDPGSLFTPAVRGGGLIFLSGKIGIDPETNKLAEGGIEAETKQTLENIEAVLNEAKHDLSDVVKCTVFLADIRDYKAMNEVYESYFPKNPPARSTVAVAALVLGARIEIECIAARRPGTEAQHTH